MEKKRPRGREKNVTEGSGKIYKRGKAQNTGGPVGSASGYAERREDGGGASDRSGGGRTGGTRGGSGMSKLLRYVVIGVIVILVIRYLRGGGGSTDLLGEAADVLVGGDASTSEVADLVTGAVSGGQEEAEQEEEPAVETLSGPEEEADADEEVSTEARDRFTTVRGQGKDVFTIMVYMCGTDLESNYGMATNDLNEMLKATISDKVNIVVETGGCKAWKNSVISSSTNQRYQVTGKGLKQLNKSVGKRAMTDPATLTDFIQYCESNFPADRYALIMWDHGGGSLAGYGYDQLFQSNGSMPLDKFHAALKAADCKFDFIGFDACLMATLETAVAAEPYADYLIASEETEPGVGWYYTNWLTKLSSNTSMSTVEIGKNIIDDFVSVCAQQAPSDKTTLSITDLAEFSGTVPAALRSFAKSTSALVDSDDYQTVSDARVNSREFSQQNRLNQVDLIDLANKLGTEEAKALSDALAGAIKYNRTSRSMTNAYGMSVYFPYQKLSGVNSMLTVYDGIGMDETYGDCIKSFASIVSAGQVSPYSTGSSGTGSLLEALLGSAMGASGGYGGGYGQSASSASSEIDVTSLLSAFLGSGDFSGITGGKSVDWIDKSLIERNIDRIAENTLSSASLVYSEKNGERVLALTEDEWALVQTIALNVFYDDGAGYIDLGLDNVYDYNADGDLIAAFDGTWLALNGQIVPYYLIDSVEEGDAYSIRGRVPALLNGERVELILLFDDENPKGLVCGARRVYANGETDTVARGLIELSDGDTLDFLCDYYDYDGNYKASYACGDQFTVDGDIVVSNVRITGNNPVIASYCLTDLYNNSYWTPGFAG